MRFQDAALMYLLIFARDWYIDMRDAQASERVKMYCKIREYQITNVLEQLEKNSDENLSERP